MLDQSILERSLAREREARKSAESLLEDKSRELYSANEELRVVAEALAEQSHRTQAIVDTAADGIVTIDESGIVEWMNPSAERIFEQNASDVVGRHISSLIPGFPTANKSPDDEVADSGWTSGGDHEHEMIGNRSDSAEFPIAVSIGEVTIGKGVVYTAIVRDMTRRRQLETQLAHALKMESVGQLAAGIAHEINTPIQYVNDNAQFLRGAFQSLQSMFDLYEQLAKQCSTGEATQELLREIESVRVESDLDFLKAEIPKAVQETIEGSGRVSKIVRAMREFSHPGSKAKAEVDLNQAIESTIVVARNEWKYVAELVTDFDPELPPVHCLRDELNQAILNLIVNAAHAISERNDASNEVGEIRISTRHIDGYAEIRVSDTGVGIPNNIRRRVFDPFFTTKPVGKGTGQGLAVVYSVIVEKHDGTIDFESQPGVGTTFRLQIPC